MSNRAYLIKDKNGTEEFSFVYSSDYGDFIDYIDEYFEEHTLDCNDEGYIVLNLNVLRLLVEHVEIPEAVKKNLKRDIKFAEDNGLKDLQYIVY